jgi:tetratricopeptide (TPR) repeat protein
VTDRGQSVPEDLDQLTALFEADPSQYGASLITALGDRAHALARRGELQAAADLASQAVNVGRRALESGPSLRPQLAVALSNLGNRLAAVNRHQDALAAALESVEISRQLADADPRKYRPQLAFSLINVGLRSREVGNLEASISAFE